ncbi:hypothetical protein C943_01853 [Mariniradius saccharolyticus AK6]|uniref:Uncharacterized protein n=1 Tax=Mariniradius saccharolyticus AK6 TaxID=1239962 RepID=M7XAI6_9BACT|nr:hypothetical protein C943_01853 [Mariniradius saccharolyticus AK6]
MLHFAASKLPTKMRQNGCYLTWLLVRYFGFFSKKADVERCLGRLFSLL